MNVSTFGQNAIAAFNARHAASDTLLFNAADFYFDAARGCYVVTVRDCIVCEPRTLAEVKAFSAMHNNRLIGN